MAQDWFGTPEVVEGWVSRRESRQRDLTGLDATLFKLLRIREGMRVIDLGAGSGDLTLELARRVGPAGRVLAVDVSEPMIEALRAQVSAAGFDNVEARVMDLERFELPDMSHDGAVARMVLMFLDDPPGALARIRNALRYGSRLAASVWGLPSRNPGFGGIFEVADRLGVAMPDVAKRVPSLADGAHLADTLAAAGFREIVLTAVQVWREAPGLEAALAETASGGMFQAIPEDQRPRAVELLRELWRPYAKGGRFRMPGEQLAVAGTA